MKSDFLTSWINSCVVCVWETIFKAFKKVGSHHNKFFILLSCNKLKPVYHVLGTFTHSLIIPLPYLNKASIKASIVASPVFLVYFVVSWTMRTTIMKSIVYILRLETNLNQWRRWWMHKGQQVTNDFSDLNFLKCSSQNFSRNVSFQIYISVGRLQSKSLISVSFITKQLMSNRAHPLT